jgi:hypothetical protein
MHRNFVAEYKRNNIQKMSVDKKLKESILQNAERLMHYNNLLIKQSNNWLSAEEGNRVMEKRIKERKELRVKN